MGDYEQAAKTWDRIIDLLGHEWGQTEEMEIVHAREEKTRLLSRAKTGSGTGAVSEN